MGTYSPNKLQFAVRLGPGLLERLEREARRRGLHRSEVARFALDMALPLLEEVVSPPFHTTEEGKD